MNVYFKQKLYQTLLALVGDGDLDRRLTLAASYLVPLQDRDIPEQYRERFDALKASLLRTPLSSDRGYVERQISTEDAKAAADHILSLFTDVMGGL